MKTRTSLQGVAIRVFAIVMLLAALAGVNSVTAQTCPSIRDRKDPINPNDDEIIEMKRNAAGECAITSRLDLEDPLTLTSNTTLNCQSHRIEPKLNPVTGRKPEVAIFLNGAQNVKIKNCQIENFDFGIFAINSKRDPDSNIPPIQIFNNDIQARFVGISFISVDYSEIRGNRLESVTKGGRPIYVGRDSDRNRILNNAITLRIPNADTTPGFRVPGFQTTEGLASNLAVPEGSAVLIVQAEGLEPSLLNAIIEDTLGAACGRGISRCLFQLTVIDTATPNGLFTEDNVVDGNIITIQPGTLSIDGIFLAISQRTIVSNNRITGAKNSIRVGAQTGPPPIGSRQFPGTCTLKPSRLCLTNDDCNIPGFEGPTGDTCNPPPLKPLFWVSQNTIIQNNIITGPFGINTGGLGGAGISTIGVGTIVAGNIIDGTANFGTSVGMRLVGKFGLETTTVTKNSVQNVDIALSFIQILQVAPTVFSAKISLNDFTGYNTAVKVSRTQQPDTNPPFYDLRSGGLQFSELSVNSKGNNWGRRCSEGGFDPNKVRNSNGSPGSVSALVKDSHPFQVRVSNTSELTPCQ